MQTASAGTSESLIYCPSAPCFLHAVQASWAACNQRPAATILSAAGQALARGLAALVVSDTGLPLLRTPPMLSSLGLAALGRLRRTEPRLACGRRER